MLLPMISTLTFVSLYVLTPALVFFLALSPGEGPVAEAYSTM
jgi:hypothetical protein